MLSIEHMTGKMKRLHWGEYYRKGMHWCVLWNVKNEGIIQRAIGANLIFLYPEKKDEMTERIASTFDKFIETNSKTDKEITKLSRDLKIDIAIDLMGFTKSNRFGIFVERCAPIQINYLGYPGTSGSNCIDYIIADKILIPKENQIYYSEKIIYLPDTYQVRDSSQKISNKIIIRCL